MVIRIGEQGGPLPADAAAPVERGTPDDFGRWVRPHLPAMSLLAARLVGADDRDDVVQESLTRAWKRWSTYRPERGSPQAWLLAIVADRARRRSRRRAPRPQQVPPVAATGRDLDLEAAIVSLAPRQRLTIELYYFADLPIAAVAAVLGCAEGTVKSTLADARERLRARLEEG